MSAPDVREVGRVDIDGLTIAVCTERGRVRLEVGSSIVLLGQDAAEKFAWLFVKACWEAAQQAGGEPAW